MEELKKLKKLLSDKVDDNLMSKINKLALDRVPDYEDLKDIILGLDVLLSKDSPLDDNEKQELAGIISNLKKRIK